MSSSHDYTIHRHHHNHGWDHAIPPVERVAPGSTVFFECLDSGAGHFKPGSTAADVGTLDFDKVNPVTASGGR